MKTTFLISLLLFIISIEISNAFADGGLVLFQHRAGSCVITLFTSASAVRAGKTDFSIKVQDGGGQNPVTNANVKLSFRSEKGVLIQTNGQREASSNKL